jgi:HSP20 family molecular chaperone IbpA
MKVNEGQSELIDYNNKLNNRMRNETIKKEKEIENLKVIYGKKIDDAKLEGEEKYIFQLSRNDDLLNLASKDYENKLSTYKDNLQKIEETLKKEEVAKKNDHLQKVNNLKDLNALNIEERINVTKDNQEEISRQMNHNVNTIAAKAQAERRHIEASAKNVTDALSSEFNTKTIAEERNFRTLLNDDLRLHRDEVKLQQKELNQMALKQSEMGKRQVSEKLQVQNAELNYLDNHQKDILNQKQIDFKIRYENMVKEHNDILGTLKAHLDTDVKKMIEQNASQKKVMVNKSEDSFYKVDTLKPLIEENKKEFMVSLAVPEHEKENVHLSVLGRSVKMTLSRRFSEIFKDQEGTTNRSTKNELFSKEFPSTDILNPKLVDQKYENGILTYRIQKL